MLEKTFEWEKLVHPKPTDAMVTTRQAIVGSVISAFDTDTDIESACDLVGASLTGLNAKITSDVEYASYLAETTREHRAAFPSDLAENAQDLQLTASIAVGELLARKPAEGRWQDPIVALAALVVATPQLRTVADGRHLANIQKHLLAESSAILVRRAKRVRIRPQFAADPFAEFSPPSEVAGFWKSFRPILQKTLQTLASASEIDREELEVLWWIYNGTSMTMSKPFSELSPYEAAFAASLELTDRAMCPAHASLKSVAHGLVTRVDKKTSTGKTLKAIVSECSNDLMAALVPKSSEVNPIVQHCPKLLPLTWVAMKVTDAGVAKGWESEFELRTGLRASLKLTPATIVEQIWAERTAQRLLQPLCEE